MTNATHADTVDLILAEEGHLRRFARRLARCEADVDDLVQDTLLRAYRARARFVPGTSVRAWTTTILRRVFLTGASRAKRRGLENDTDAGGPLAAAPDRRGRRSSDDAQDFSSVLERVDDRLKRALSRVPDIYLLPFRLSAVDELTCAEIGDRLGAPTGTVMSRIHRARERLKRELAASADFGPAV